MDGRHFFRYVAVVLLLLNIMTFQTHWGPVRPLAFVVSIINFTNEGIDAIIGSASETVRIITQDETELTRLRQEIQDIKFMTQSYIEMKAENERLREILAYRQKLGKKVNAAKIISRGGSRWSDSLVINKGTADGVTKDMSIVTPEGLVGKVVDAGVAHARVLLMDNSRFSVAVRFRETRIQGVYTGQGNGKGILKYVGTDVPITEDAFLVTSGLDALFPPGIPVGRVFSIETDTEELFHVVEVRGSVDLSSIEEVIILSQ
jgi:rod shape-determining protein MreC